MTNSPTNTTVAHRLERIYPTDPATIWRMWTTPDGIARWWAPRRLYHHGGRAGPARGRRDGLHDDGHRTRRD